MAAGEVSGREGRVLGYGDCRGFTILFNVENSRHLELPSLFYYQEEYLHLFEAPTFDFSEG